MVWVGAGVLVMDLFLVPWVTAAIVSVIDGIPVRVGVRTAFVMDWEGAIWRSVGIMGCVQDANRQTKMDSSIIFLITELP